MRNALVPFSVVHRRLIPKRYEFKHHFFWFKINLDSPREWPTKLVSMNRFNLYSFFEKDHLKLGKISARENFIEFIRQHGVVADIKNVTIHTQLRFLGYIFNPISLVILTDVNDKNYAIIEIGNTFNELKPYFVNESFFNGQDFSYQTEKLFYISPFIAHDNTMKFSVRSNEKGQLNIFIEDGIKEDVVLQVSLSGYEKVATTAELIKQTVLIPFITFKIIFLIHWHALFLWLKGIKYFKKEDNLHLQQGTYKWKE